MSSNKNEQATAFRTLKKPIEIGGVTYGPGCPVFTIRTAWGEGLEAPDYGEETQSSPAGQAEKPFLSKHDVAGILGISVRAVEQHVRKKRLGCVQLTKRKRVFTQELIDDFIRRESGVSPARGDGAAKSDPLSQRAATKPLPVEEARALLKKVMKRT
jgi:hypothetical protein